jgi:hypothetical protein
LHALSLLATVLCRMAARGRSFGRVVRDRLAVVCDACVHGGMCNSGFRFRVVFCGVHVLDHSLLGTYGRTGSTRRSLIRWQWREIKPISKTRISGCGRCSSSTSCPVHPPTHCFFLFYSSSSSPSSVCRVCMENCMWRDRVRTYAHTREYIQPIVLTTLPQPSLVV